MHYRWPPLMDKWVDPKYDSIVDCFRITCFVERKQHNIVVFGDESADD